jgi:hypothetical protein
MLPVASVAERLLKLGGCAPDCGLARLFQLATRKRMRENKLMLTLTQRSLGAIPVSERRAAEMLKKVVVIAATVLVVSAVADVTLEGSG